MTEKNEMKKQNQCDQIGQFFNFGRIFKAFGNN